MATTTNLLSGEQPCTRIQWAPERYEKKKKPLHYLLFVDCHVLFIFLEKFNIFAMS